MTELMVPPVVEDSFREHYRELILGSFFSAAEAQSARHRARGHRSGRGGPSGSPNDCARLLPPRRCSRSRSRWSSRSPHRPSSPSRQPARVEVEYECWFGPRIRTAARLVWFATLALLVADIAVLGINSLMTSAADLGLVAMTIVWFCVGIDDLIAPDGSGVHRPDLYG